LGGPPPTTVSVSNDGATVYTDRQDATTGRVDVVAIDVSSGSVSTVVEDARLPTVSADGRMLAYLRGSPASAVREVHVVDLATSSDRMLPIDGRLLRPRPPYETQGDYVVSLLGFTSDGRDVAIEVYGGHFGTGLVAVDPGRSGPVAPLVDE